MSQIETNQRLVNFFIDLRHCGDNHIYLTKSKAKGLLDIPLVKTQIYGTQSVKYNVSRTGTTSEITFHIYLCTNVPIH